MPEESRGRAIDPGERRVLDALPERIVVCRRHGEILLVNRLAESLLGRSSAELQGRSIESVLPRRLHVVGDAPLLEHLLGRGDAGSLRGAIVHRRGVQIEVELAASPYLDGDEVALVLRQVPERGVNEAVPVEDVVRAEIYRLVFEDAPVGILHFDDRGVITACNEPLVRIIGSSRRVLVGLDMTSLPFRPIASAVNEALSGKRAHFEGIYPSATSSKLTQVRAEFAPIVDEHGRTVGGVGIAEDVTDRVRAEQALRRSFESVRALIENAPDAIAVRRGDRFVLVNSSLVRMLGYSSADELLTTPVPTTLHPDDRPLTLQPRSEADATAPTREVRLMRKDGATVLAEIASLPVHYEDEPAVLLFARDVTECRRLEATLAQAERMASIGTLAAGVAHEINNPLAYVMGNLELLERQLVVRTAEEGHDGASCEPLLEMLREARDGCERVRSIVRDLRIFSRSEPARRSPVNLQRVIEAAVNVAHVTIGARAQLVRELEEVPPVLGDEPRLGQVVLNLLLNAAQAIPEGAPDRHAIHVGTRARGANVELFVRDDGEGIPPQLIGRLFEPFFTTKPVGVGTGLGLSICRGIVQTHGGTIQVESEVGRGTTFRVLLPATQDAPPGIAHAPATAPASRGDRRARILVIDDELQLGRALRATLSAHDVVLATSGREGLRQLLSDAPPDLILCDVMMPDVSGLGVYEALRRDRPELCERFVFMTGGVFPEASIRLIAGPQARELHKPFEMGELERMLAAVRAASAA